MAITVNLITDGGTTSQTVASGASIQVSPSTRVQIVVDGVVIDPNTVTDDETGEDIEGADGAVVTEANGSGGTGDAVTDNVDYDPWAVRTLDVSAPVQLTSNSLYERGQSIAYDGVNYWLFYGRSTSVTVV